MFEVDLESLATVMPESGRRYQSSGRFPESYRDMALIVDAGLPSRKVQGIIERNRLVSRSIPFDVYSGEGISSDKKSVAYRVVFQSPKGTLTAEQVNNAQEGILRQLERELGARLRE